MQGREFHDYPNNINCVIQCVTNSLDQSIHSIIEQNKLCQEAEVRLQNNLSNCVQDNTDLNKNYTIQSGLLNDTKEKLEITSKDLEQLSEDFQRQNLSCVTTEQQLKKDLASCEENYTYTLESNTKQLENVTKELESKTKQLSVFINHLQLLESVYNQVAQMEICRIKLKEYCELNSKGESLTKFEKGTMMRFERDIGCKGISKNYYGRILSSYTIKLDKLLEVQEMLVGLLITGNLEEMEKVQEQEKYLPFNNCQFICELGEQEEATKTNYFEKVRDATWSILQGIFK